MPDKFQIEGNLDVDGAAGITGIVTATSFVKNGGTSSQFLKADGTVDSNTYLTSDNDTTYAISADNAGSDKSIVLTAGGAGSGISSVVLEGGENVTITRAGNKISIASTYTDSNTDTTYNEFTGTTAGLVPTSTNSDDTKFLRADGTWVVPTDTNTDTNTTYDLGAVDGTSQQAKIQLTGSDSTTDEVKITAGNNLSLTRNSNDITISVPSNITVGDIIANNVSVAQTLTYENVTDIDSVGMITARSGIRVLSGGIDVVGVTTVTGTIVDNSGTYLHIKTNAGEDMAKFQKDGPVFLYWNSLQKLATSVSGISVTGNIDLDDNGDIRFGDNNDLKISHTNSLSGQTDSEGNNILAGNDWASYIHEDGTGPLVFKSDGGPGPGAFQFYDADWKSLVKMHSGTNSRVSLFYGGLEKLVTSEHGIDVTGHIEADTLHVSGISTFSGLADVNGEVKVGTGITIGVAGVATAHNLHVGGILKGKPNNNQLAYDSHWIPTTNAAYDIGSAEFKVRHLFLSDNSLKFVDSSNNEYPVSVSSGNLTYSSGKIHDSSGSTREIVNASKTAAYTLTAANVGGLINTNSDVTVPSGIFSAGQAITIYNNSGGNISVKRSGTTIWTAGTDTNTDKTLAQKGVCTVLCVSSDTFVASGAGMS